MAIIAAITVAPAMTIAVTIAVAAVILVTGAPAGRRGRCEEVRPFVRMPPAFPRTPGHATPPGP
ncbi:hypothetical protein ACWGH8_07505 [Nonomuraea muscovyensis]|uniref:Uncharacterized protein n=1 Tax=Nonomuraea muscovyensis TaxID=1124761 RepID=A0A7X0EYZ0_9ACTN|nr:hypothetical protein [Nonomuraea muscovyensis]MBB6349233.1 hypothetical protein [Nonomuraea muscovyensis]